MSRQKWRPQMTDQERKRGLVFFALYLFVFPYLNGLAQRLWMGEGEPSAAGTNLIYYAALFALALLVFWSFLHHGFHLLADWLPENLFAFLTGLGGWAVLSFLVQFVPLPVVLPIAEQWREEYALAPGVTVALVIVFIPLIEEILFRGLVFGNLRQYSRPLAYAASAFLFSLASVWRYALELGDPRYLLTAILYLPVGLALAWSYDNGGSIWSAVALRMVINSASLFLALR